MMGRSRGGRPMTEAEWLVSTKPLMMLDALYGKVSDRKLRLFGCAAAHILGTRLGDVERRIITTGEQYADDRATREEVDEARLLLQNNRTRFVGLQLTVASEIAR